jgi:YfiH family protein
MTWHVETAQSPEHVFSDQIARFPFVRHAVTTRGHGAAPYNLSLSIGDDRAAVLARRAAVTEMLGFESLLIPRQVHGSYAAIIDTSAIAPGTPLLEADAAVTRTPGILLGITAADCLPVLFLDPVAKVVGLAHSGWRGTAASIVAATLNAMQSLSARPERCLVAIGPGIGPEAYEVDEAVFQAFDAETRAASGVFAPTRDGHYALDLSCAVTHQLLRSGVREDNIDVSPWRTHARLDLFTSHRLSPGCARFGAFIGLVI